MATAACHPVKAVRFLRRCARAPTARTPQWQRTIHPAPRFVLGGLTFRHSAAGQPNHPKRNAARPVLDLTPKGGGECCSLARAGSPGVVRVR